MVNTPTVTWAEVSDSLFLTVELTQVQDIKVELTETHLKFSGKSQEKEWAFELEFKFPIDAEKSTWSAKRHVEFKIVKKEEKRWEGVTKQKLQWLKINWAKWVDSDDEDGKGFDDLDQGMGGMGGMPGMGGMGGMGGMDLASLLGGMGGGAGGFDPSMLAGLGGEGGFDPSMLAGMGGEEGDSDDEDLPGLDAPEASA